MLCRSRRRACTLATFLLLLGSPALAQAQTDVERCKKGHTSPDDAIAACTAVIRSGRLQGAQLAPAYSYTGNALLAKRDIDGAIANYDRAIQLDPGNAVYYGNRGDAWGRKGQHDRAISDSDTALRLNPRSSHAYTVRANAWDNKGEYDRALADYDQAIRLDARRASLYASRSNTVRRKGDLDRALADAELAVRLDANLAAGYNSRANAWDAKGDLERAIADYDQAIRLNPANSVFHANRGNSWHRKGDLDRALADMDAAVRLDPANAVALASRANVWRRKGDLDRAMADSEQAIGVNPRLAQAHNARGNVWAAKGDPDRSIADYSEAIRLAPKVAVHYSNRGLSLRKKGDVERSIAEFDQAIRLDATNAVSYTSRGLAFEARGDRDRARSDFNAALAVPSPDDFTRKAQATARTRLSLLNGDQAPKPGAPALAAQARDRVALVIGNGAYVSAGVLANPVNDARAVASALREVGFDVSEGTDLDRAAQERVVRDFLRKAATARVALFYYAGHGMQVDGKNYLVPIDARIGAPKDLAFETLALDKILAGLDDETRTNIVILDACRDNPLGKTTAGKSLVASSSGLATISGVSSGMLVAFATAPDKIALDSVGARNSPFSAAFIKHLRTPGLEVRQMLTRVRADVVVVTQKKQVPWDTSSLTGDIYLAGAPKT